MLHSWQGFIPHSSLDWDFPVPMTKISCGIEVGASLGMHMIGNNNVKLQGNVSAPYGISEALRVFCQCGVPFKKILVIRESKNKSIVRKNAEMVLVPLTGNVLRRTLASTRWSNLTMSGKSLVL